MRGRRILLGLALAVLGIVIVGNAVFGIDAERGGSLWYRVGTTVGLDLENPRPPIATTTVLNDDGYYETDVTGGRATLDQLATHLGEQDQGDRLFLEEGVWHVEGTLRIGSGAQVTVTGQEVRLVTGGIEVDGGRLEITDSDVYSWDYRDGIRDVDPGDGRAWIRAGDGYLSVRDSALSELGFDRPGYEGVVYTGSSSGFVTDTVLTANYQGLTLDGVADVGVSRLVVDGAVDSGITASGADGAAIADVTVSGGAEGIAVRGGRGVVVRDATIRGTEAAGVVVADGAADVTVTNSEITRNDGWGMRLADATDVTVVDTLIYLNEAGVEVTDGARAIALVSNRIAGNADAGVFIHGGARVARLEGNRVDLNGGSGVVLTEAGGVVGPDNVIEGNLDGVEVGERTADAVVRGNRIADNIEDGVSLPPVTDGTVGVGDVRIVDNRIAANRRAAFSVTTAGAADELAEKNLLRDNGMTERIRETS